MCASKQDRKPHRGNELRGVGRCRNRFQAVRCAAVKPVLKLHKGKHVARLTQLMDVIKSEALQVDDLAGDDNLSTYRSIVSGNGGR